MKIIADLHLHSKYSRAVSPQMELKTMACWAEKKGIDLLATGDWTHPMWFKEIKSNLEEDGEGIFKVKGLKSKMHYVLSCEISNIYTKGGKGRRIH
ncbi:MAG: DNA helicase UvrD, partial [Candidatus Beckwithbacteria bacterium]